MTLGMIITQTEPETVFNALRLALFSLQQAYIPLFSRTMSAEFISCAAK